MKRITKIAVVIGALTMLTFSQCYYDEVLPEPAEPVSKEVSFQVDILPIFNASCNGAGCHNTGGVAPDLSPDRAYDSLISGNYIDLNTPENSELYLWMTGKRELPMPLSGPNPTYNALVLAWIQQGAPNN